MVEEAPTAGPHEMSDVHSGRLWLFVVAFLGTLVLMVAVLWLMFGVREGGFSAEQPIATIAADGELGQREQLRRYRADQQAELERLAWTDDTRQFAKVPIEDAMGLLAAKGADR